MSEDAAGAEQQREAAGAGAGWEETVAQTERFLALEAGALAALLQRRCVTAPVPSEVALLDIVLRWVRHEPEARVEHLGALLQHVRLALVPLRELATRARAEPLSSAPVRVQRLLIEVFTHPAALRETAANSARVHPPPLRAGPAGHGRRGGERRPVGVMRCQHQRGAVARVPNAALAHAMGIALGAAFAELIDVAEEKIADEADADAARS